MRTMLLTTGLVMMLGQGTARPGDIPRPDVWIKNSSSEAIPVDLRDVHVDKPLKVLLMNGESSGSSASGAPIRVRVVPPTWSYRAVTLNIAADPAAVLEREGANGWETTGLSWTRGGDTIVVLKRPR